jgi:hypothetical protein
MIFGACLGRGNCRLVAFPVVTWHRRPLAHEAVLPGRTGISAGSRWRPQQDSNLRTRLRSAFPCTAATSGNLVWAAAVGRVWGAALERTMADLSGCSATTANGSIWSSTYGGLPVARKLPRARHGGRPDLCHGGASSVGSRLVPLCSHGAIASVSCVQP